MDNKHECKPQHISPAPIPRGTRKIQFGRITPKNTTLCQFCQSQAREEEYSGGFLGVTDFSFAISRGFGIIYMQY
jgi:hypothetical protein